MPTLLMIGDDVLHEGAAALLEGAPRHTVLRARTGDEGVRCAERYRPDVVLLDLHASGAGPLEALDRLQAADAAVIVTGRAMDALSADALSRGAEAFLSTPVAPAQLESAVARAVEKVRLRRMARGAGALRAATARSLLGPSSAMRDVMEQVERLAASDETAVLLVGESGTGKGRVAEYIHARGPRAAHPFVGVACVALPVAERDGETGRAGALEAADGGTLFLDEVSALDEASQRAVLGALTTRRVTRAGGAHDVAVDVRLVASTACDLVSEVTAGRFREDLYYRLSAMPVCLPPLRARAREDLEALVASVTDELAGQLAGAPREVEGAALDRLVRHRWPGNVRELRSVLERALLAARGAEAVRVEHLPPELRASAHAGAERHSPRTLEEVARAHIERTLHAHGANRTHAARELGISRATLIKKIKEYGLA